MCAKGEGANFPVTCRGKSGLFLGGIVTKSNMWKENYLIVEIKVGMWFLGTQRVKSNSCVMELKPSAPNF